MSYNTKLTYFFPTKWYTTKLWVGSLGLGWKRTATKTVASLQNLFSFFLQRRNLKGLARLVGEDACLVPLPS